MRTASISILIVFLTVIGYQSVNSMSKKTGKAIDEMGKTGELATCAGGCFWCTESDFEKVEGVLEVVSGYTGGRMETANYRQVSAGATRHAEAVQVRPRSDRRDCLSSLGFAARWARKPPDKRKPRRKTELGGGGPHAPHAPQRGDRGRLEDPSLVRESAPPLRFRTPTAIGSARRASP